MNFFAPLTDIIRTPLSRDIQLADRMDDESERIRRTRFQRLFDYYMNDEDAIKRYTHDAMRTVFKDQTRVRMLLPYLNIFRRIINRLCMVYRVPAERYIVAPSTLIDGKAVPDPRLSAANDTYQEMLSASNINQQAKVWHRYAKAFDTCYVKPVWRGDHMEIDVFAPHQLTVTERPENYLEPAEVVYQMATPAGEVETYYWSDTEHSVRDESGKPVAGKNEWGGVNKYGVLPLIPLRLRDVEHHWGEGDSQLADVNEKINVLLASTYYNAILQTHGQLVTVNFKIADDVRIGPDAVISAENVMTGDVAPSAQYIQPQPAIEACIRQIDWMTKTAAMMRGLPAASVSIEETAQSGAAKAIDSWELMELREDDIESLRPFEKRLFEVMRVIWNFHQPSQKQIPEDVTFGIDFEEVHAPVSEKDRLEANKLKLEMGLWTPVDDMVDEDEGIDRVMAEQMVAENLSIKGRLFKAPAKSVKIAKTPDGQFVGSVEEGQ